MAMASSGSAAASAEALKKLDDQLTCSICLDRYADPRTLPCLHCFCKRCIEELLEKGAEAHLTCPICRKVTKLDEEGAITLPKSFHINNLLDIDELLKKSTVTYPECAKHKKIKNFYCEKCEEHVCFKCSRESHKDHLNDIEEAEDLFDNHVKEIRTCLLLMKSKITEVKLSMKEFDVREGQIRQQSEAVKNEIDLTMQQHLDSIQEFIQRTKEALVDRVETATHQKLELHSLEKGCLETTLVEMKSCEEFVEGKLGSLSHYQIQAAKKELVQCISDAHSMVEVSDLKPGQSADIEYVKSGAILLSHPRDLGTICSTLNYQSVDLFSVDIPQLVLNGPVTEVSLIMSISLPLPVELILCKMKNVTCFAEDASCRVQQLAKGRFVIIIKPEQPGMHELSVCISDNHINGSPFKIPVKSIAEWRGQSAQLFARGLKQPRGLAVTDNGDYVVVTEWHGHRVSVFSADTGELLHRIGRHGTGPGTLVHPDEVEVSNDNHIFVKDEKSIQKFSLLNGSHKDILDVKMLKFSNGMTVLPFGNVLTGAELNQSLFGSIVKMRSKESQAYFVGGKGWSEIISAQNFDGEPADIVVDSNGCIYVLTLKFGIHIFSQRGKYQDSFGKDYLKDPYEFCIDSRNIIYVTDDKEVKMFSTNGWFLGSFGNYPKLRGIGVSKTTGDLYFCKASGEVYVSHGIQK